MHIWVKFPGTGKMVKMWHFFTFFWSSAVTKRFDFSTFLNCSVEIFSGAFKNVFVLALAHLEPELQLFEVDDSDDGDDDL